jgi:hypothetical protein
MPLSAVGLMLHFQGWSGTAANSAWKRIKVAVKGRWHAWRWKCCWHMGGLK